MRVSILGLAMAAMARLSLANWVVESYTSGCNSDDGGTVVAGQPGQELWCIKSKAAHNIVTEGLEADNMEMWLYSSWNCNEEGAEITHIDTDGCHVIPSDTVIEAVRVLPK